MASMPLVVAGAHLIVAALLGASIGLERQWRQRLAGLRTNSLVALGAATFVMYSRVVDDDAGAARIAAQVVSGIGFLGAGVIFKEGLNVRGLNTAATLWCSAAVGLLAGGGLVQYAVVAAALVIGANLLLRPLVQLVNRQPVDSSEVEQQYHVSIVCQAAKAADIRAMLVEAFAAVPDLEITDVTSAIIEDTDRVDLAATVASHKRRDIALETIVARFSAIDGVMRAGWSSTAQSA